MSASFNVTDLGNLAFASVTSAMGWPTDQGWMETEPLVSSGVDNTRWRQRRLALREWQADSIAGFTSYALAAQAARNYQLASGRIGRLTLTIAGAPYVWSSVHAELDSYSVTCGPIYGSAVTASSTHQLRASWRFTLTELSGKP